MATELAAGVPPDHHATKIMNIVHIICTYSSRPSVFILWSFIQASGFTPGLSSIDSTFWLARSPVPLPFTDDVPKKILRICMKRYVSKSTANTDVTFLLILQNFLFGLVLAVHPLFPFPPESTREPPLGGRRKLPPPLIEAWPAKVPGVLFLFRRRSPCCNFGGRRAWRDPIVLLNDFWSRLVLLHESWTALYCMNHEPRGQWLLYETNSTQRISFIPSAILGDLQVVRECIASFSKQGIVDCQ